MSQAKIPLWPDGPPNSVSTDDPVREDTDRGILWIENVHTPTLEVYSPAINSSTGVAVIICPGGGYTGLAYDWEGTDMAKWLNSKGITAFVLKYRLPISSSVKVAKDAPLQDAQRAIRLVRQNAKKYNVNPNQIGIMGFSAGGHLASTLGTHFNAENTFEETETDKIDARPDFMALIYPVITMKKAHAHMGSRTNLLGSSPKRKLEKYFSNELHIDENTPPTFLVHATDDTAVPVENSLLFYQGLKDAGVFAEMHIYPQGGHGFALGIGKGHEKTWIGRFIDFVESLNME